MVITERQTEVFHANAKKAADNHARLTGAFEATFELARRLKFTEEFRDVEFDDLYEMRDMFDDWACDYYDNYPIDDLFENFVMAWEIAKVPYGDILIRAADATCEGFRKEAVEKYGKRSFRTFVASLCLELQQRHPKGVFCLSGRMLSAASQSHFRPVSQQWCSSILKSMVKDGTLVIVDKPKKNERRATIYRTTIGHDQ